MDNTTRKSSVRHLLIFLSGITLGFYLWDAIILPFHNPWNVVGQLTVLQFNPNNNILRFITFLLLPSLLLSIAFFFKKQKTSPSIDPAANMSSRAKSRDLCPNQKPRFLISLGMTLLWISLAIVIALNLRTFGASGPLDTFHEGESLGTAISYQAGEIPYKDFLFVHGFYQDPFRAVLGFELFGKSIGAVRTLESILKIFTWITLILLVYKIHRGNNFRIFITLIPIVVLQESFLPQIFHDFVAPLMLFPRDLVTCLYLILIVHLYQNFEESDSLPKNSWILWAIASFLSASAFIYSIDRGFFLFTAHLIVFFLFWIVYSDRKLFKNIFASSFLVGLGLTFILWGVFSQWNYSEAFHFVFGVMPKYKELMDGHVFSIHSPEHLIICTLMAFNFYWLTLQLLKRESLQGFVKFYFVEIALLMLSIFFFRSALGRADWVHISFNAWPTYLLSGLILTIHFFRSWQIKTPFIFIPLIFIFHSGLISENFPLKKPDSEFIPAQYKNTIAFLKNNLAADESFVTLTSEAAWYYFADKPCPIRFPVIWFAGPEFYQDEIIRDLKEKKIKFILLKNKNWTNTIDGIPNEKRIPKIFDYIHENFVPLKAIDGNELWVRK